MNAEGKRCFGTGVFAHVEDTSLNHDSSSYMMTTGPPPPSGAARFVGQQKSGSEVDDINS